MRRLTATAMILVLLAPITPAFAKYDRADAERDCTRRLERGYGFHRLRGVASDELDGKASFRVTGRGTNRNDAQRNWSCKVVDGDVVSVRIKDKSDGNGEDDDDGGFGAAALIGLGILGLAGAALLAGSNDSSPADMPSQPAPSGPADPMTDLDHLQDACRNELDAEISREHGDVESIAIDHSYLSDRSLDGDGVVEFSRGGTRQLSFSCEFDPNGRLIDGEYHYYGS